MRSFTTLLLIGAGALLVASEDVLNDGENAEPTTTPAPEDGTPTTKAPIHIDLNNLKNLDMPKKTRLLFYEYSFESKTAVFDESMGEESAVFSTTKLKYAFEIVHHDPHGSILARYRLIECISGPCNYPMPDVYVDFIQGGNNLEGLYAAVSETESAEWNPLFAIVHTINTPAINGAGDEQNVVTPYGLCHYRFMKPEDKRFKRRINNCHLEGIRNHTLGPSVVAHKYEQEVLYIQNTKVDADIVIVEAEEKMSIHSPMNEKWNLALHSVSHLEMLNRTRLYVDRFCPYESLAGECAETVFKAKKVGKNWREIKRSLLMGRKRDPSKLPLAIENYRKRMHVGSAKDVNADLSTQFGRLVDAVVLGSESQLASTLREFHADPILPVLVNALGSSGTNYAHQAAKDVLVKENPGYVPRYLESLSLATKINTDVLKDLRAWMDECSEDQPYCEQIAFTLANLLRRSCESSKSRQNACDKDKDNDVNEFVTRITRCDNVACHERALQILMNLPVARVVQYADQFLCTVKNETSRAQAFSLRLLSLTPTEFIERSTINKIVRIFRNSCPLPQGTTDQTLASDVLLNAVLHHTTVGTYLLRSESLNPDNHEKWAYFYDSVEQRRAEDEMVEDYWAKMRKFRVFRPNYAHRSLISSSNVFGLKIAEMEHLRLKALSKAEFANGNFRRNEFALTAAARRTPFPLFGIATDTYGLESFLADSEAESTVEEETPEAFVQLSILNSRFPATQIFSGYGDLMSAVWNANGEPFEAFNTNVLFRQFFTNIPLLSGLSATNEVFGSASVILGGSVEISLWNRDAKSSALTNVSMALDAAFSLFTPSGKVGEASARISAVGSVTTDFDVEFHSAPYLFCTVVGQGPLHLTRSFAHGMPHLGKRVTFSRTVPGSSFVLNEQTSRMCSHMTNH